MNKVSLGFKFRVRFLNNHLKRLRSKLLLLENQTEETKVEIKGLKIMLDEVNELIVDKSKK